MAEKGIETKYNTHLIKAEKDGRSVSSATSAASGSASSTSSSYRNSNSGNSKSIGVGVGGSIKQGGKVYGFGIKSNDIFNSISEQNGSIKNRELRQRKEEMKRDKDRNILQQRAFQLSTDARELHDPTRLLFDSACIYDELGKIHCHFHCHYPCHYQCHSASSVRHLH